MKESKLQMEREMKELKRQRDLAQSQLELERRGHKEQKVLYKLIMPPLQILVCI